MSAPDQCHIDHALRVAAKSPCRSKRGVVLYNARTGAHRGEGFNGPPSGVCPGRAICAGTCGQRSVHAEVRALRDAAVWGRHHDLDDIELLHIELASDGGVAACAGPSCWQCAREVLDVGFVRGVWLYELSDWLGMRIPEPDGRSHWRRYTAGDFYAVTLKRCGMAL